MNQNGSVPMTDGESTVKPSYKKTEITLIKILGCLFSLFTFVADVGSDIYVAVKHDQNGNEIYLHLTILFVILPAVIMSLASFRWYMLDNSIDDLKVSKTHWIIRTIFLVLLMAPALRSGEALYYARKSFKSERPVDKENYARRVVYENTDASFLRLIEAFMECAPQLILQIYIVAQVFCHGSNISMTEIVQLISIAISLISMTNAIVLYSRNLRESLDYKKELTWCISIFPFLYQFFDLAARVLALGLFASVLLPYFFVVCGIHFCLMLLWIHFMNTNFCDNNKFAEFVYNMVLSFIYIFCFINPTDEPTRIRSSLYHSLIFVENTVIISLWYHHICLFQASLAVLIMVFVFFVLAIIIKVFYYALLHPARGRLFRETNLEEMNVRSESRSSIADRSHNLIDRTRREVISEEMQTATVENGNPAELSHLNDKQVECSEL